MPNNLDCNRHGEKREARPPLCRQGAVGELHDEGGAVLVSRELATSDSREPRLEIPGHGTREMALADSREPRPEIRQYFRYSNTTTIHAPANF